MNLVGYRRVTIIFLVSGVVPDLLGQPTVVQRVRSEVSLLVRRESQKFSVTSRVERSKKRKVVCLKVWQER